MLAKTHRRIVIEDLNVRGMASNRSLARSIMDGGFGMFRRQLEYKAALYGSTVVLADRWYPSSRTCSCCGSVKAGLVLSERVFRCDSCGFTLDRDWNAARNLEKIAASSAVTVCGGTRSGPACGAHEPGETGFREAETDGGRHTLCSFMQKRPVVRRFRRAQAGASREGTMTSTRLAPPAESRFR